MSTFSIPELNVPFFFRDRPSSVPPDLRPDWRIAVILMLLRKCCRDNRASFARLHVLNWAVRSAEGQRGLEDLLTRTADPESITVRIEPALNRAVDYARGERLVEVKGDRVQLTTKGINLADDLAGMGGLFVSEKQFISRIGKKLTEQAVNQILRPTWGN